ncbi:MAG TPA: DUF2270 domain-containing protein [Planctomycetes bacterium]|nr:DUF2270 domain-containing protein [Planctomycetota bacterium]
MGPERTSIDGSGEEPVARPPVEQPDYESTPITRPEYISAMVHLYRGELYRATTWRIRLDATTNWAVLTTAGLLSVAFGTDEIHSHVVLLIGMSLITVFWAFESRRYRIADVWYSRLRKIEENFYGPILRRDPHSPRRHWGTFVAEDLFHPTFKVTRLEALRARFLRNYWAIYSVLLAAWVLRLFLGTDGVEDVRVRLTFGPLPYWLPLLGLLAALIGIFALLVFTRGSEAEKEPDHWQIPP